MAFSVMAPLPKGKIRSAHPSFDAALHYYDYVSTHLQHDLMRLRGATEASKNMRRARARSLSGTITRSADV